MVDGISPAEDGQGGHPFPHPGVILTDDTNTLDYLEDGEVHPCLSGVTDAPLPVRRHRCMGP